MDSKELAGTLPQIGYRFFSLDTGNAHENSLVQVCMEAVGSNVVIDEIVGGALRRISRQNPIRRICHDVNSAARVPCNLASQPEDIEGQSGAARVIDAQYPVNLNLRGHKEHEHIHRCRGNCSSGPKAIESNAATAMRLGLPGTAEARKHQSEKRW